MSEDPTPYGRHDETVTLRLELARERDRAEAFRNSLNVEVLKVMRVAVIQATIDADNEIARLKAEVERLTKAIDEADDKLKLLAEWAVVCEVESAQVNQVRDILRNAAKEGKPTE